MKKPNQINQLDIFAALGLPPLPDNRLKPAFVPHSSQVALCLICDGPVIDTQGRAGAPKKVCSDRCCKIRKAAIYRRAYLQKIGKVPAVELRCDVCGAAMPPKSPRHRGRALRVCSPACARMRLLNEKSEWRDRRKARKKENDR